MAFFASSKDLTSLFRQNVFDIPINQRKYVWDKKHWKDLLDDIFLVCSDKTDKHFIGSVVLNEVGKRNGINFFTIIDGQQRITTLIILLSSLYQVYLDCNRLNEAKSLKNYVYANSTNNENVFILNNNEIGLREIVDAVFLQNESFDFGIIKNQYKDKKNKKIFDAYEFFYNSIKDKVFVLEEKMQKKFLTTIFNAILNLQYIETVATSEEDSYTIFEILNARGQKLDDHELLKNLLLKYSASAEKENVKNKWNQIEIILTKGTSNIKAFIKHYSMHKYESENYKVPYEVIKNGLDRNMINEFLNDLYTKALLYRRFINPGEIEDSALQKKIFSFFKNNGQTQYRPLVLSLLHNKNLNKITENELNVCLDYLMKFFICFTLISGEKSNKIENVIYKYANKLENSFTNALLQEFISSLKSKFPKEEYFLKRLETLGWSKRANSVYHDDKNKINVKIVLELIEAYLGNSNMLSEYTLEHVIDDSSAEDNAKIGNIIPLEEELNKKCCDKTFEEKLLIYKTSQMITARRFAERFESEQFDIFKRHKYLSEMLYKKILKMS